MFYVDTSILSRVYIFEVYEGQRAFFAEYILKTVYFVRELMIKKIYHSLTVLYLCNSLTLQKYRGFVTSFPIFQSYPTLVHNILNLLEHVI
jgi:hypothetical protein